MRKRLFITILALLLTFTLLIIFLFPYSFFHRKDNINIVSVYEIVNNKEVDITNQIDLDALYYALPSIRAQRLRFIYGPLPMKDIAYDIRVQHDKGLCHIIVTKDGTGHISTGHYGCHNIPPTNSWTDFVQLLEATDLDI